MQRGDQVWVVVGARDFVTVERDHVRNASHYGLIDLNEYGPTPRQRVFHHRHEAVRAALPILDAEIRERILGLRRLEDKRAALAAGKDPIPA